MRWFGVALVVMVGSALPARAETCACAKGSAEIWPTSGALVPTNPRLVVQASGPWISRALELATRRPRLASVDEEVPVRVKPLGGQTLDEARAAAEGQRSVLLVLVPERPLVAGTFYQLKLDGLSGEGSIEAFFKREGVMGWMTGSGPDHEPPRWDGPPRLGPATAVLAPCGSRQTLRFFAGVEDTSGQSRLLAHVVGPGEHSETVLLPAPKAPEAASELEYSACEGGLFPLTPRSHYRVELVAVDAAGNGVAAPKGALRVSLPEAQPEPSPSAAPPFGGAAAATRAAWGSSMPAGSLQVPKFPVPLEDPTLMPGKHNHYEPPPKSLSQGGKYRPPR